MAKMPLSSINTPSSALAALATLRFTRVQLEASQKQLSTGYVVADALDNGAVFGIAQAIRSSVAGNVAATQQLSNFIGVVQAANASATGISNSLKDLRAILIHMSDSALGQSQFNQYQVQYNNVVALLANYIISGNFNGINLVSTGQALSAVQDGNGQLLLVTGTLFNLQSALGGISVAAPTTYSGAASILSLGTFNTVLGSVATVLNQVGDLNRRASLQQGFNQSVRDSLEIGLGSLIDADLSKESAINIALRVRNELSIASINIANQTQTQLLSIFTTISTRNDIGALFGANRRGLTGG